MGALFRKELTQLFVVAVLTLAVGVVIAQVVTQEGSTETAAMVADRVLLTSPFAVEGPDATTGVSVGELPLTAAAAVAAGWEDPVLCDVGTGRTFIKKGQQDVPYLLIYNQEDDLQGLYLFSKTEVPTVPWVKKSELIVAGRPVIEDEHWAALVHFKDPVRACGVALGGCGFFVYCDGTS